MPMSGTLPETLCVSNVLSVSCGISMSVSRSGKKMPKISCWVADIFDRHRREAARRDSAKHRRCGGHALAIFGQKVVVAHAGERACVRMRGQALQQRCATKPLI